MNVEVKKVKVWDIPTRLFHWLLIILMAGLWWTASEGEMEWHQILAYSLLIILCFRWIWGFIGSETSRFKQFIHSPSKTINYIKSRNDQILIDKTIGHNPAGGYMVIALLILISVQFVTGLFTTDDIYTEGPLYSLMDDNISDWLSWLHHNLFYGILGFVAIHVFAVIIHTFKGDAIISAMVHGNKVLPAHVSRALTFRSNKLAALLVSLLIGLIGYFMIWPVFSSL